MRKLVDVNTPRSYTPTAIFIFRIQGHDGLEFEHVHVDGNTQSESLAAGLLIPFMKRFSAFMSMHVTCSAVTVAGRNLALPQLEHSIRSFVNSHDFARRPTEVVLTLDLTQVPEKPSIKRRPPPVNKTVLREKEELADDINDFEKRRGLRILGDNDDEREEILRPNNASPPPTRRQKGFEAFFPRFANTDQPALFTPRESVSRASMSRSLTPRYGGAAPVARRAVVIAPEAVVMSSELEMFERSQKSQGLKTMDDD